MDTLALGLVETMGLVPALEAADTAVKSADVTLTGLEFIGRGLVTVKLQGDISSVKAGVEAARSAAERLGQVQSYTVIGRTGEGIPALVCGPDSCACQPADAETEVPAIARELSKPEVPAPALLDPSKLSRMRVVHLRKLARSLIAEPGSGTQFPMTPEQVKFARKKELIKKIRAFLKAQEK